jgi:hypothetical protein
VVLFSNKGAVMKHIFLLVPYICVVGMAQEKNWIQVPETSTQLQISGKIQLNGNLEFYGGKKGLFQKEGVPEPAKILLKGDPQKTNNLQYFFTAASSSITLKSKSNTSCGDLTTEIIINGGNSGPRFDKAFAQLDTWLLIGYTGSLFASNGEPDTLIAANNNIGGPKSPQVRLISKIAKTKLTFSYEDTVKENYWNSGSLVTRWDVPFSEGNISLRGVARHYQNNHVNKYGYATALGLDYKVGSDKIVADLVYGKGAGNFISGTMGLAKQPQDIFFYKGTTYLWEAKGACLGYTHVWTPTVKSNLIGSLVKVTKDKNLESAINKHSLEDFEVQKKDKKNIPLPTYDSYNKKLYTMAVNTIWEPNKAIFVGGEVAYNYRNTFGNNEGKEACLGVVTKLKF